MIYEFWAIVSTILFLIGMVVYGLAAREGAPKEDLDSVTIVTVIGSGLWPLVVVAAVFFGVGFGLQWLFRLPFRGMAWVFRRKGKSNDT